MGSSKKKRDKDKDGERKKHKRDKKEKSGDKKSRDKSERRRSDDEELLNYALHEPVQVQQNVYDYGHGFSTKVKQEEEQSKDEASLSIEETNKIRAKLGLKPLTVPSTNSDKAESGNNEEVHAPPVNIAQQESQEKYREKLKEIREKREMQKKLGKVKRLAESDSDNEDSALMWVNKVRKKESEKELAAKRAKLLEEMDEEFGVSELVENVMGNKTKGYTARNLKGLTVEHSAEMIKEGKDVVLTLKDSGILDNEDDVLVNINLIDMEKANKNIELRKKKPGYQAYDEFDEAGEQKVQGLLSKYDEEIDGEKKKSFSLGGDGGVNLTKEQELQKIRDRLKNQAVSLTLPQLHTQSEYYTEQEMLKFKKPKKRRKIKKRETLKPDDLIPLENSKATDHGSRNSRQALVKKGKRETTKIDDDVMEWQMADPDDVAIQGPDVNNHEPLVEDDDAQLELQLALERSRRSKIKKENVGAEKVIQSLTSISTNMSTKSASRSAIVLDSTSEFCRTLGEIPTYGASGNREDLDDMEEDMDEEKTGDEAGGWEVVRDNKLPSINNESTSKDSNVLDDEPTLGLGVGAALLLVQKKGLIESDKKERKFAGGLSLPETVKVIDEEKMRDEERERLRERGRDRDRERYNPNAFKEKADYKPDVKLEYVDEQGRHMNPKEAFRYLSHKFHGKIPGKLKSEKRQKKFADDMALKKMNAGDTPLNTVALFSEKQKQGQTPYLILSGGGQTFSAGPTIQKGK